MKKRLAFVVTLSLVVMMLAGQVFAQNYPTKQINLIIQAAPGGLSDLTARTVGSVASEILGVPIVFTNRPGAAGAVAMSYVKESGYTIGYVPVGLYG